MKKFLAILSILAVFNLFTPLPASASGISLDTFLRCSVANTTTTQTCTYTVSGANPFLECFINQNGFDNVTSVKFNGVSFTQLVKAEELTGTSEAYVYYLVAPGTGAHTLQIQESANANQIDVDCISYDGVSQSFTPDSGSVANLDVHAGGNFTYNINVTRANSWVNTMQIQASGNPSASVNATLRSPDFTKNAVEDSNAAEPTGNYAIGYTYGATGSNTVTMVGSAFPPATATASFNFWQFNDF